MSVFTKTETCYIGRSLTDLANNKLTSLFLGGEKILVKCKIYERMLILMLLVLVFNIDSAFADSAGLQN